MDYFRIDNTEGYTPEQLAELNTRLRLAYAPFPVPPREEMSALRGFTIPERIQAEYDTELSGR